MFFSFFRKAIQVLTLVLQVAIAMQAAFDAANVHQSA